MTTRDLSGRDVSGSQPADRAPVDAARLPQHIAIVMDGNGRWAERRHQPRSFGHRAGVKTVREVVEACLRLRIPALTLFAFSSENWQRPEQEVSALMKLFLNALDREVDKLAQNGVRLRFIGDLDAFAPELVERMRGAATRTAANTALALNVAVNYGGQWDIAQACARVAMDVRDGMLDAARIDTTTIAKRLSLADLPDPDLFIRTGGDQRISNFLLWQLAYAELWFTETLWPDFDAATLDRALHDFARRERRFGRTSAQVRTQ